MRQKMAAVCLSLALMAGTLPASAAEEDPFDAANVAVGKTLTIGTWEQDNDPDTDPSAENLEWTVLKKEEGRALVITKQVIDARAFYDWQNGLRAYPEKLTWENSDIRLWLNGEGFYDRAFTEQEKQHIQTTDVITKRNPFYKDGSDGGADTRDKLFFLSDEEASDYFDSKSDRQAKPTDYAANVSRDDAEEETEEASRDEPETPLPAGADPSMAGALPDRPEAFVSEYTDCSFWWLRTPGKPEEKPEDEKNSGKTSSEEDEEEDGYTQTTIMCVGAEGSVVVAGFPGARTDIGIRPAMWITIQ